MNNVNRRNTEISGPTADFSAVWYRVARRASCVAAVFTLVIAAVLLVDYVRSGVKDPLDSPQFLALKDRLADNPQDETTKQQIRRLDLELRKTYFRQLALTELGGYLLLGGIVVFLIAAKTAASLRRKLPMPGPLAGPQDTESQTNRLARWLVAVLTAVLIATAVALIAGFRSELPNTVAQLAAMLAPEGPETPAAGSGPAAAVAADYPSEEEIRKHWPRFRGPGGSGISAYTNLPTSWDGKSRRGILWKTPVPLEGHNSPVVWADRVFLTGATKDRREIYCFDADSGKLLWQRQPTGTPQSTAKPPEVSEDTGYAAPSTTTDGRRVYAVFANGDLAAVDFAGNEVWARSLGIPENAYGHASSLVMWRNLLLVQFDQGSARGGKSKLLALDAATGKTVWQVARRVPNSWATPIVIHHAGRNQIITAADPWVIAYDVLDGSQIWRAKCLSGDHGVSPVFADGVVYVGNEYCRFSAVRADGQGDVTKTHVLWTAEEGLPDTVSPLITEKYVLLMPSWSVLTCYDANSGELVWEEEFEDALFVSSPGLAGNRVYLFSQKGKSWVVEPGPKKCKRIAEAELGEDCVTSPALLDGRIYIRGKKHLFCIGEK